MAKKNKFIDDSSELIQNEELDVKSLEINESKSSKEFIVGCQVRNIKNNNLYIVCSLPDVLNENSKIVISPVNDSEEKSVIFKRDLELV